MVSHIVYEGMIYQSVMTAMLPLLCFGLLEWFLNSPRRRCLVSMGHPRVYGPGRTRVVISNPQIQIKVLPIQMLPICKPQAVLQVIDTTLSEDAGTTQSLKKTTTTVP